jgi:hypothetical protein
VVLKKKQTALILLIVLLNIVNSTWKDLAKYNKNLVFVIVINAFYYYLCKRHLVWEFRPGGFSWKWLRFYHTFVVTPLLILLYLSKLPSTVMQQVAYTINWVIGSFVVEYGLLKLKMIKFKHGWNLIWSGLLYLKMYTYSHLFTTRPILASILSLFSIIFLMIKFRVPLTKRHLKGPLFMLLPKRSRRSNKYKILIGSFPKRFYNKIDSIVHN